VVGWELKWTPTRPDTKEVAVAQSTAPLARDQVNTVRERLQQQHGLPFLDFLSRDLVADLCLRCQHQWRNRIYTPWITLGMFLSQVLSDNQCCDAAVDRFQKFRSDSGLPAVSSTSTSYCDARLRLPEELTWELVRQTGRSIHEKANKSWLYHGRSVKVIDGSTVSMPDTSENQAAYPQQASQAPGLGFPIARILVIFSLAVGTVLEAAIGPYQGKQTSELALLRKVVDEFEPGDIALADRFFCSYWVIAELTRRGADVVVRLHQRRKADFRRGRRLGRGDHLVTWTKPEQVPAWMTRAEYNAMPAELSVREIRVEVTDKAKRVRTLVIVTTLTDAKAYRADGVRNLYRQRWQAELNLRSLKTTMHMDVLRTKTPEMVRKEVAMHLLGYNLIRGIMGEAARADKVSPRRLSFAGALHTVRAFEESHLYDPVRIRADLARLLELIAKKKKVGGRPDRYEPRAVKRRPKPHPLLTIPRKEARRLIASGIILYNKK
jgi:putative transposase